jgi:hypothetical protein
VESAEHRQETKVEVDHLGDDHYRVRLDGRLQGPDFATDDEALTWGLQHTDEATTLPLHIIPITPAMRESVMERGQVLFSVAQKRQHKYGVWWKSSEWVSEEAKAARGDTSYTSTPRAQTLADAAEWLGNQPDFAAAKAKLFNEAEVIEPRIRMAALSALLWKANEDERSAASANQQGRAAALAEEQAEIEDWLDEWGMKFGQAIDILQMRFRDLSKLTPRGWVLYAQRKIGKARAKIMPTADQQLIAELLRLFGEINGKTITGEDPTKPGEPPKRKLKTGIGEDRSVWSQYLDWLGNQLADAVASRLKGRSAETVKAPLQEFVQRIIVSYRSQIQALMPKAEEVRSQKSAISELLTQVRDYAENIEHYREAHAAAASAIRKQYAEQPDVLTTLAPLLDNPDAVPMDLKVLGKVIREEIGVRELARMHYTDAEAAATSLAEKLAKELGLTPAVAEAVAARVKEEVRRASADAKRKAVASIVARANRKTRKAVQSAAERLIGASNMGALDNETAYKALQKSLKLPEFSPEFAAEIRRRVDAMQKLPEGMERQEAIAHIMGYVARQTGISATDIGWGFAYANMLMGLGTHAVNVVDTAFNVLGNLYSEALVDPKSAADMLIGLGTGAYRGLFDAAGILKTGVTVGTRLHKAEGFRPLELLAMEAKWWNPVHIAKYVGRAMSAEDIVQFRAVEEMRARQLANRQARAEGITGWRNIRNRVDEILKSRPADYAAAEAQAAQEIPRSGWRRNRRAAEIIEQQRDPSLVEQSAATGRAWTYNQPPMGSLGVAAGAMNYFSRYLPIFRAVVPFTDVVANVFSAKLDWTPWGFKRAAFGQFGREVHGTEAPTGKDRAALIAKAATGTLALAGLLALALKHKDDEDPKFAIYADGPSDFGKRAQWIAAGGMPYTMRFGNQFISYRHTPFMLVGAIVGAWADAERDKRLDDRALLEKTSLVIGAIFDVMMSQSFLSGLQEFMRDMGQPSANGFRKFIASTTRLVTPSLIRDVESLFIPVRSEATDTGEALTVNLPFVRAKTNPPKLDVLGEPVKARLPVMSRFASRRNDDPVWRLLSERQLYVPTIGGTTTLREADSWKKRRAQRDELYELNRISGPIIRQQIEANLGTLRTEPRDQAQKRLKKIADYAHAVAKRQVMQAR